MSTPITYETDHIPLLHDLKMSTALNFLLLLFFYVFHRNLKKDRIRRNINSKKKKGMFICENSIITFVCRKLGLVGPIQQKIKLPLPHTQI